MSMRRLFDVLAGVSLLLFVAIVVLYIRGFTTYDVVSLDTPYHEIYLLGGAGSVRFVWGWFDFTSGPNNPVSGNPALPAPGWHVNWSSEDVEFIFDEFFWDGPADPSEAWRPRWLPVRVDWGSNARWFSESPPHGQGWGLTVSYWPLALITAAAPAVWIEKKRRSRRRRNTGLCAKCGYDLRATPERCPECGTVPPKKNPASN
jgi:hypothetical protein